MTIVTVILALIAAIVGNAAADTAGAPRAVQFIVGTTCAFATLAAAHAL